MSIAFWAVLVAAMLPYLATGLAKSGLSTSGGYDNRAPREWAGTLTGWRQRADWAQRNHFEAFPMFAAAVIIATLAHAPQGQIDALAGAFVVLRVAYTAAYIADLALARSFVWFLGLICGIALFCIGI